MTKFFRVLPGVACVILASPAWAGFDFVTPEAQSTAPVAAVEQAVLPPPPGVTGSEIAPVAVPAPVYAPAPTPVAAPVSSSVANGAPLSIAEPDDMMTGTAYGQQAPVVRAAPPVAIPESAPVYVAPRQPAGRIQTPQSVYPPVGNQAARPLAGARTVEVMSKPVAARVIPPRMDPPPVSVPVSAPVQQTLVSSAPIVPPAPVAAAPSVPPVVIDGFGTRIPLSLAMEQVVPAGYTVDDQVHVDPDTIVSWVGGRPFDKVLEDMLYAHGVRVSVNNKTVTLKSPVAATPVAAAPVVVPPAPAPISVPPVASLPTREVEDLAAVPAMPPGSGPAPTKVSAPVIDQTVSPVASSVAPVEVGAYDPARVDIFSARTGESVKEVLTRWGRIAHIQVIWQMENDLTLPRSFAVNAAFPRALERFFDMYRGTPSVPSAVITAGPDATVVIRPAQNTPGFRLD